MHAAVRSPLTAGIALCGASAIALTPIAPTMPTLTELQARAVSSAEVALTAAANPIDQWAQVIQQAFVNGGVLVQNWAADPLPILRQLLTNGLGYGQQITVSLQNSMNALVGYLTPGTSFGLWETLNRAVTQISQGQFYDGVNTLFEAGLGLIIGPAFPLLGLTQIPVEMAQKFANVVSAASNSVLGIGLGALGNVAGVVSAFGKVGQDVIDALGTGDVIAALNAILGAPATIVGAVLNGFPETGAPGLLSPGGLVDQLMNAAKAIAVALGAVASAPATTADTTLAEVSSVPDSVALSASTDTVTAVTVSTTVTEEAATEEAVTEEAATEEPVVEEPVVEEPVTEEPAVEEPSATTETETGTETNGGTDLSGGNKAEPGSTGETGASSGGTGGGDEADSGTTPSGSTDTDTSAGGDSSTGSGDSDSSGGDSE